MRLSEDLFRRLISPPVARVKITLVQLVQVLDRVELGSVPCLKLSKFCWSRIVSLQLQTDAAALSEQEISASTGRSPQAWPVFVDKRPAFEFDHLAG